MVYGADEPRDFHRFLGKFNMLDHIKWDEYLIDRSIKMVCEDLIADNIDYTWMRFTINKYMRHMAWHRKEAILFVKQAFDKYAPGRVGLVLSLKYESERAGQRQLARMIEDPTIAECIVGIDLVGDEGYYDVDFYKPIFDDWRKADKLLFAHVGESQSVDNVRTAIEDLGVTEINHGLKAWEHHDLLQVAADNNCCFHLALTSNFLTGVVEPFYSRMGRGWHPVSRLCRMVPVTIGTDDPVQCDTTLDQEFALLRGFLDRDLYVKDEVENFIQEIQLTAQERVGIIHEKIL
jgi:adenosine deaminase